MTDADAFPVAIVRAIAEVEGIEPHELDYSLHEHVATDAITTLASNDRVTWELTFEVPDHEVAVSGTGEIRVDGDIVSPGVEARSDEPLS